MKKFERSSSLTLEEQLFSGAGPLKECGECEACGCKVGVIFIRKVLEASGSETHLESFWMPLKDIRFCPICGAKQKL